MSYLSPLVRKRGYLCFLSRELTQDSRETPAGRCGEEEEGEQRGGGSVVSEGSSRKLQGCLLNTPMYLSAAGKARCGDEGTPGPAQRRDSEGGKADHCSQDSQPDFCTDFC